MRRVPYFSEGLTRWRKIAYREHAAENAHMPVPLTPQMAFVMIFTPIKAASSRVMPETAIKIRVTIFISILHSVRAVRARSLRVTTLHR